MATAKNEGEQDTEARFFSGKRPWSRIKDRVLGTYMPPYLSKVAKLGKPILLIDCFAGPGKFNDNSIGSPLIMCQAGDKYVSGNYLAVFVNKSRPHHELLNGLLSDYVKNEAAFPVCGDAQTLLRKVQDFVCDSTVFLYLDPFGLKGCEFDAIAVLLGRGKTVSTEVLINVSMPTLHRLSSHKAIAAGRGKSPQVRGMHDTLSKVLGGDFWKDIMFDTTLEKCEKELRVMQAYMMKMQEILPYSGCCPVRESRHSHVKYYMTFCSRHPDAMVLMNDLMLDAYNSYIDEMELAEIPLIAPALPDWKDTHCRETHASLKRVVEQFVLTNHSLTRASVWEGIVKMHFMVYRKSV
jgi:three-Cys-motif partner protein